MHRSPALTYTVPQHIIDEAAGWLMRTSEGELAQAELQQLSTWRAQSPEHERAWQAAMELQLLMSSVPTSLGKTVLGRPRTDRRTLLKSIAAISVTLPAAGLAYRHWPDLTADLHTAIGEHREVA
ncbi:MAG TPA: DUF4880 domain-containing protein, partial [Dongiaceae bacterium]|nr:DUF4880 domain-containing protein [Dongiaceae bacterium]